MTRFWVPKAANSYSGGSGANQSIAFDVTPTGTTIELVSQVCSCGTSMNAYTTAPGTWRHGLSNVGSMVADGFYDDMPTSVSPITVSQVFNLMDNTMDVLGFSVELLGGVGSPTPTPMPSATATPVMALTKTSNVSMASIGNTVTYCSAYQNGSTGTATVKGFPYSPGWMSSGVKLAGWNAADFLYGLWSGGSTQRRPVSEAAANQAVEPKPDRL